MASGVSVVVSWPQSSEKPRHPSSTLGVSSSHTWGWCGRLVGDTGIDADNIATTCLIVVSDLYVSRMFVESAWIEKDFVVLVRPTVASDINSTRTTVAVIMQGWRRERWGAISSSLSSIATPSNTTMVIV